MMRIIIATVAFAILPGLVQAQDDQRNRVQNAYRLYAIVDMCRQVRKDYAIDYIDNTQFYHARVAIANIVADAEAKDPSIELDTIWNNALKEANQEHLSEETCYEDYTALIRLSPRQIYTVERP